MNKIEMVLPKAYFVLWTIATMGLSIAMTLVVATAITGDPIINPFVNLIILVGLIGLYATVAALIGNWRAKFWELRIGKDDESVDS